MLLLFSPQHYTLYNDKVKSKGNTIKYILDVIDSTAWKQE